MIRDHPYLEGLMTTHNETFCGTAGPIPGGAGLGAMT